MIKIAVCDDNECDRDSIIAALSHIEEKWKMEFDIETFSCGEELCEGLKTKTYQILLLDILMEGIDGIETAKRIRTYGDNSLIIYISSYDKRVKELFEFRTISFLDKPLQCSELEKALRVASDILKKDNENIFSFKKRGSVYYLPIDEIICFEASLKKIIIQTEKERIEYYDSMKVVWETMKKFTNFIMPNRSYVFNLKYVFLKSNTVVLKTTNNVITIGRNYKRETYDRYYKYMEERSK